MAKGISTRISSRMRCRIWSACRRRWPGGNITSPPIAEWKSEFASGWKGYESYGVGRESSGHTSGGLTKHNQDTMLSNTALPRQIYQVCAKQGRADAEDDTHSANDLILPGKIRSFALWVSSSASARPCLAHT